MLLSFSNLQKSNFHLYLRALQEAQDIFGLDFDFGDFEKFGQEEYSDEERDDYEDEYSDEEAQGRRRRKKTTQKTIYDV